MKVKLTCNTNVIMQHQYQTWKFLKINGKTTAIDIIDLFALDDCMIFNSLSSCFMH